MKHFKIYASSSKTGRILREAKKDNSLQSDILAAQTSVSALETVEGQKTNDSRSGIPAPQCSATFPKSDEARKNDKLINKTHVSEPEDYKIAPALPPDCNYDQESIIVAAVFEGDLDQHQLRIERKERQEMEQKTLKPTWKFRSAIFFLRSMKPVTEIQTRISNVGDKSPTEASSHSVGSAKRLTTSSFRSYEELVAKKSNSDLQFEQLLAILEKDKKKFIRSHWKSAPYWMRLESKVVRMLC
uniref:Uncharacterized protein n=1 Tax=Ditylenchus dipsaci TaxID=166011 RepID=A0A915DQH8_9BILA